MESRIGEGAVSSIPTFSKPSKKSIFSCRGMPSLMPAWPTVLMSSISDPENWILLDIQFKLQSVPQSAKRSGCASGNVDSTSIAGGDFTVEVGEMRGC